MVAKLNAANKFGPYALVIGTAAGAVIQGQFTLYQTGKSAKECRHWTGVSPSVLFRALASRDIPRHDRRHPTPPGLVADFTTGESVKSLADRHGIADRGVAAHPHRRPRPGKPRCPQRRSRRYPSSSRQPSPRRT